MENQTEDKQHNDFNMIERVGRETKMETDSNEPSLLSENKIDADEIKELEEITGDELVNEASEHQFSTQSESEQVASLMAMKAAQRGWQEVNLTGSATFRRAAWLEMSSRGVDAHGFVPTQENKRDLIERLSEHGLDEKEAALEAEAIFEKNWSGNPEQTDTVKADAIRSLEPSTLADRHPDLQNQAAAIKVAEIFSQRIKNDDDREKFLQAIRERVATSYDNGKELPKVLLREEREIELSDENIYDRDGENHEEER